MVKKIIGLIGLSILLVSCASTTSGGLVGVNRSQFSLVSAEEINNSSAESYHALIQSAKQAGRIDTGSNAQRVRTVFNRLLPHTTKFRPDALAFNWEIQVIKSNELNAFAMPGGKMVVYTGIIDQLNLTNDELAAIVGHEMAHVLREHSREKISQEVAKGAGISLVSAMIGFDAGTESLIQQASQVAFSLPFSRRMETEADLIGLELIANAGYNPEAVVTLWEKMSQKGGGGSVEFLSTHPSDASRIARIKKEIPKFR